MKLIYSKPYIFDIKKAIDNNDISMLDNKSFFITGGLGLICSAIIDVLLTYGKTGDIFVGCRNENQFNQRYEGFNKVKFIKYDALDTLDLNIAPDYIIHGAGLSSPELYTNAPVETILTNFEGVHNLLEYAKNKHVKRLLYISSSEIYGNKSVDEPFAEGQYGSINIDNIRSSYPIAKISSEMLCKAYSSEYGVDTVIVRPGHIYGPSAKENDKRISSDFAFKAARGEKLEMLSPGLQKRSYCYSIDCAMQILAVLAKGKAKECYNIGHDEVTTIRQMAQIYAKAGNIDLSLAEPSEEELQAFNPMNNSSLDNSKVKALGYKDTFSLEEGLTHTVQTLREIL